MLTRPCCCGVLYYSNLTGENIWQVESSLDTLAASLASFAVTWDGSRFIINSGLIQSKIYRTIRTFPPRSAILGKASPPMIRSNRITTGKQQLLLNLYLFPTKKKNTYLFLIQYYPTDIRIDIFHIRTVLIHSCKKAITARAHLPLQLCVTTLLPPLYELVSFVSEIKRVGFFVGWPSFFFLKKKRFGGWPSSNTLRPLLPPVTTLTTLTCLVSGSQWTVASSTSSREAAGSREAETRTGWLDVCYSLTRGRTHAQKYPV